LETIGRDLNEMQRVPLAESHVAALRAAGTVAHYAAGTFLVQSGDRVDRFVYVEDGEIEVVNPFTDERHVPSTLGPNQFMVRCRCSTAAHGRCRCARFATRA
jgi:thioredoxin reductase (NADPH)